jgi:hypothetical protein
MKIIGSANADRNNGAQRVTYRCDCGYIGTTRACRAMSMKWCPACSRKFARLRGNNYTIKGDLAFIDVSTKKFPDAVCVIDAKNVPLVIDGKGRWYAADFKSNVVYAVRNQRGDKMHRHILGTDAPSVDHDDGNGLNNTEANLKPCAQSQNMKNTRRSARNKSGVTGVVLCKQTGLWQAQGGSNGKYYKLGRFDRIEDAAAARRAFEIEHGFNKNHGRPA